MADKRECSNAAGRSFGHGPSEQAQNPDPRLNHSSIRAFEHSSFLLGGDLIFTHLPYPWLVPVVLALAGLAAWWGWRNYGPRPPGFAGTCARLGRCAALALLVLACAGPTWRTASVNTTPAQVTVAVDRSASMALVDQGKPRIASAGALAEALGKRLHPGEADLDWRGIAGPEAIRDPLHLGAAPVSDANGGESPLADDLARLAANHRPDRLIVVTDGRVTGGGTLAALGTTWRGRDLPVDVLVVGSDTAPPDLRIDELRLNHEVALGEREPVVVRLAGRGLTGPIQVKLKIGDEPPVTAVVDGDQAAAELTFRTAGRAVVTVTATAPGPSGQLTAQDSQTVLVRERKLTVLYLEHRPRYEARYLREAFRRDRTVTLHSYLAEGRWRRWGDGPDRLPLTPAELQGYDALILGDLGPDALKDSDLAAIDGAVRRGGLGLVVIPGETGATAGFAGTRLGELLPSELADPPSLARGYAGAPLRLNPSAAARRLGLFQTGAGEADKTSGDWRSRPRLLGAATLGRLRPGGEVLAEDDDGRPLVTTRAQGAGRCVLIAVDDTWRWRKNAGDAWLHRFHSQILRFAAAGRREGARAWHLAAQPRRAAPGESVDVTLLGGIGEDPPDQVTVRLVQTGKPEIPVALRRDADGLHARIAAPGPGSWTIEAVSGIDLAKAEPGELAVLASAIEIQDPRADREALKAFATACGARLWDSPEALVAALPPDLRKFEDRSEDHGWWDTPWLVLAATLLLGLDWALRRLARLP